MNYIKMGFLMSIGWTTANIIFHALHKIMKEVVIIADDDNVLVGGESEVNRNEPGTFGEVKNRIGF